MNCNDITEFIKDIKDFKEIIQIDENIYTLRRLYSVIRVNEKKIIKGEITKSVNLYLKQYNSIYNTNFICKSDLEYGMAINNAINYLNYKALNIITDKIIDKSEKEMQNE